MHPLTQIPAAQAAAFIDPAGCGAVYPLSMAAGYQGGSVFTDGTSALFWHDAGFAYLYGRLDEPFLSQVHAMMTAPERRLVLFAENEPEKAYFREKTGLAIGQRCFFSHSGSAPELPALPAGMRIVQIGGVLLRKLSGRVTPAFSWKEPGAFLQYGRGFCILDGDEPAAWAFSAAVSEEEIDIGVETCPAYQGRGLATIAAGHMIRFCYAQEKRPVWACSAGNTASRKTAEKLGFTICQACDTFTC